MNAIQRQLGLLLGGVLVVTGIWACTATRNPDGSVTVEVTPDKTIRAKGLEDALSKLTDLLTSCLAGTIPCAEEDLNEINKSIDWVLRRKMKILDSGPVGTG